MQPTRNPKTTALLIVGIVVALLFGLAGGWLLRSARVNELAKRVAELEKQASAEATGTTGSAAETEPPASDKDASAEEPSKDRPGGPKTPAATERQPGEIVDAWASGGAYRIKIDYIQFLTGDEAAAAAAARGDESPPPNDYYIVNENPKVREFPVKGGIKVRVVTNPDGTIADGGRLMTLADWVAGIRGPQPNPYTANFYWVTVTDGVVTAIEQQYLP